MKLALAIVLVLPVFAQTQQNGPTQNALSRATRMSQLMESTAVAVPGLTPASESVRHLAEATLSGLRTHPGNPAEDFRFINEVRAYLALSETFPASQMPPVAEQQFGELREDLVRFQQSFESSLEAQSQGRVSSDADPNDLRHYSEANTKLLPLGTLPRVVFLGDSLTARWHLNETFPGRDFVNRGIDGQTTSQMLGRFLQDVVLPHPKAVVIEGGSNDIANGIPSYAIEDTLTMLGELARLHGVKPVFASIAPVSAEAGKTRPLAVIQQVNRWLKEYCAREGFTYLDLFGALADANGGLPADLTDDGVNLTAKGYSVISPVTLETVNRALALVANPATPGNTTTSKHRLPIPNIVK
jgi:lysophospholipase L1-like esterase